MKIFTEKRPDDEELPTGTILAHIKSFAPLQAGILSLPLFSQIVPYLEYVINARKDTTPELHNELALNYLETIMGLKKTAPKSTGTPSLWSCIYYNRENHRRNRAWTIRRY